MPVCFSQLSINRLKLRNIITCKITVDHSPRKHRDLPYLFDKPPWALIKFVDVESGRLFEAGAYSRLGAY